MLPVVSATDRSTSGTNTDVTSSTFHKVYITDQYVCSSSIACSDCAIAFLQEQRTSIQDYTILAVCAAITQLWHVSSWNMAWLISVNTK